MLTVVAVIAVLVSLLVPTLARSRQHARVVCVHADLRQIGLALEGYAVSYAEQLPPTRMGCGEGVELPLPEELARDHWLPSPPGNAPTHQVQLPDLFNPTQTYKYRAPGAVWYNGQFYDLPRDPFQPRAWLWVPDDFPHCATTSGRRFSALDGEPPCPARYAIWSVGPDPMSPKFPRFGATDRLDESKFPLPRQFWMQRTGDTGLIVHFTTRSGATFTGP
jgi:type II secretory pathway pseudopilin PulG